LLAPAPAAAASAAAEPGLAEWQARLEKSRADLQRLTDQTAEGAPLLAQRQVAAARLTMLLAARVEALKPAPPAPAADETSQPLPPALAGPPPYRVLDVDVLRDRLDLLSGRQAALEQTLKSLETNVTAAARARDEADAQLRLRRDPPPAVGAGGQTDEARAQVELAEMLAQARDVDLLLADEQRRATRTRLAALSEPLARLHAELERVRPDVQFPEQDLDRMVEQIEARRRTIAADGAQILKRLGLGATDAAASQDGRTRAADALRRAIQRLNELDALAQTEEVLWRARRELIEHELDLQRRRETDERLEAGLRDLRSQRRQLAEDGRLLRRQLATQLERLGGLAADDPQRAAERSLLEALQTQAGVQDRLDEGLERVVLLAERTREDLHASRRPASASEWGQRAVATAAEVARAIWQYELFSATEAVQIDGRTVTIEHAVTVGKSIGMLLLLGLGYWGAGRLAALIIRTVGRGVALTPQMARVLQRWVNSILLLVVLLVVLKLARIPLTAFAFLGGALAIGLGFGAQNVIKNLISGVIILFERKIRVGDVVTIGGMSGTVTTVDLRATTVRGFDGIDAIVPNSTLLENQISNWSGGSPDVRRTIAVGVAYGSDIGRAAQIVLRCAQGNPHVLPQPPADVLFEDFAADSLLLRLRYWTRLDSPRGGPGVDSDLRFAIHDALRDAGIVIAFPQRDVHLDVPGTLRVELGGGAPAPAAQAGSPTIAAR
jgi:small-conductance mechanosensitive channel